MKQVLMLGFVALVVALAAGCAGNKKALQAKDARISELESTVSSLESELEAQEARNAELSRELEEALAEYKEAEQVWLERKEASSVVTVSDAVLFNSGSVTLSQSGEEIIDKIAGVAKGYPDRHVRVEGHTDDVGIAPEYRNKYPSNWELSTRRATAVVRRLVDKHGMEPDRLSAIGFGEYRPVADNETSEGRAKNRRVVIVIGPKMD
jgi:chemotaxis protein MotB